MGQAVKAAGCEPLIASMIEIKLKEDPIDLERFQGVLATSGNAVRALEKATEKRDVPLYCIGPQTRQLAESLGFTNVKNSFGGHKNLPIFLARETTPDKGPILYLHGGNVMGNPIQDLANVGFRAIGKRVYSAGPVGELSDEVRAELEKDVPPEIVTFLSIRTFKLFRDVMEKEGLIPKLRSSIAVCISPTVADFAREIRWKMVCPAEDMTGPAVIRKVVELKESAEAAS